MQIIEKKIGLRDVRIVYFDNYNYSKDYFIQKMKKKNIYFDYIVVLANISCSRYWKKTERYLYTNNFMRLENDEDKYFSVDGIIKKYEESKEYQLHKRENKLERILNE
jgi:hypothetical protein